MRAMEPHFGFPVAWHRARVGASLLGLLGLLCLGYPAHSAFAQSSPQLFGSPGLDTSFCKQKTFRQTVVYVDDTSIAAGDVAWAKDLANKLKATLTPGERVTVVELSPSQGTSNELWSACWPDYTAAMKAKLAKGSYFFTSNPLNGLNRQQGFFLNGFGQALTKNLHDGHTQRKGRPRGRQLPTEETNYRSAGLRRSALLANDPSHSSNRLHRRRREQRNWIRICSRSAGATKCWANARDLFQT